MSHTVAGMKTRRGQVTFSTQCSSVRKNMGNLMSYMLKKRKLPQVSGMFLEENFFSSLVFVAC